MTTKAITAVVLLAITVAVLLFCKAIVDHAKVKPTQEYEEFGDYFK